MENLIRAVRKDSKVGVGSCSYVDECFTDTELADYLSRFLTVKTESAAVALMQEHEGLMKEQELNSRDY